VTATEGLALAGIVLSAFLGYLSYRIARDGRDEAKALERDRWAREDRHRSRAEKVVAYSAFLAAMEDKIEHLIAKMNLAQAGADREDDEQYADPNLPLQTIIVLAPEVAETAQSLYDFSVSFGLSVLQRLLMNMGVHHDSLNPVDFDAEEYHRRRDRVIAAIQADLDTAAAKGEEGANDPPRQGRRLVRDHTGR
jgi:hypothetical protein